MREKAAIRRLFLLLVFGAIFSCTTRADRLPFKYYTTAEGLAYDTVNKIMRDSRGFLWFCTGDGLSRFNGYNFKTYGQDQGLPSRRVNDMLETKDGTYLIATAGGIAVFDPLGRAYRWNIIDGRMEQNADDAPMFRTFTFPDDPENRAVKGVVSLTETADGRVYAGTNHGLFQFERSGDGWQFRPVLSPLYAEKGHVFNALLEDHQGGLWIITSGAVFRRDRAGATMELHEIGGNSVFEDRAGRIWVGSGGEDLGLRLFTFAGDDPQLIHTFTVKDGLLENPFSSIIAETDEGRLFVVSRETLGEFLPNAAEGEPKFRFFESQLIENGALDSGGNIWFGTSGKGAWKLSLSGFEGYGPEAGVPVDRITGIYLNHDDGVFAVSENDRIGHLNGTKFETIVPFGFPGRTWGETYLDHRSADGEWWIPSKLGLYRYPAVASYRDLARTPPIKVYTVKDGLFGPAIFTMFEDSHRDLWISASNGVDSIHRWERSTDQIHRYSTADGIKASYGAAVSFGEDPAGDIWIAFYFGGLMRYRNGQFRSFTAADGIPEGYVTDFLTDSKGRFWIATRQRGLFRVDHPEADAPLFKNISSAQGLLSNEANCLADNGNGQIYIGTGRGLNRFDPDNNTFKVYSQADGLPANYVSKCRMDKNGVLWLASINTLARFTPVPDKPSAPPPVFIEAVAVNGTPIKVSELGEAAVKEMHLGSDQRQIQIDFFALGFNAGDTLRYQYQLNEQNWSVPSAQRSIALNLAAGTYRFAVRAITADGVTSKTSATVNFTIARPIWQRWWFLLIAGGLLAGAIFALDRYRASKARQLQKAREERIAELQRVRTRIATDLHDDIGSSLTQIAVFSELARQRESENGKAGESLDMITNVSSELVDTMSDIVWAINPRKDHLQDLTQRMRRFAANVLSAKDIDLEFHAPAADHDIPLGANIRREVFLIFKETVNNIVKHSEAKNAVIDFRLVEHALEIEFKDDGKGFEPAGGKPELEPQEWKRFRGGNGLLNMKKRAVDLGGAYEISSVPGEGTNVKLRVPFETTLSLPQ